MCSPTSYMLWSLYVWHSETVIHLVALSEEPKHPGRPCRSDSLSCSSRKAREVVQPMTFEVFQFRFRSLWASQVCCTKKKKKEKKKSSKDTDERSTLLSYSMSIHETSSIIFQFAATLKYLDVNILVLPNIQHTLTHTHT